MIQTMYDIPFEIFISKLDNKDLINLMKTTKSLFNRIYNSLYAFKKNILHELFLEYIYMNNIYFVQKFIDNNIDINNKDIDGNTPLINCVFNGYVHINIIKLIIKNGADINAQNNDGISSLMISSLEDNYDITKILIDEKEINIFLQNNDGHTALSLSFIQENVDIRKLISAKLHEFITANVSR